MPLYPPSPRRVLKHTRTIVVEAYAREDGLWDFDACLTDVKTHDMALASGTRAAGSPMHDLWLRITTDRHTTIVAVQAAAEAVPYPAHCPQIVPDYAKLVGLNLMQGFRQQVRHKLAGTRGCTHLTELVQILPTAAMQALTGEVFAIGDSASQGDSHQKPFQLDRCHALRSDGAAVELYYPRWAGKVTESAVTEPQSD